MLESVVELAISQTEVGNPRSSATASLILADLPRFFEGSSLLVIALNQPPSISVLNFTDSLLSLPESAIDLTNESIASKLLLLAFRCHNIGAALNRHTAARVVEKVNEKNSEAVMSFAGSLGETQKIQFQEFLALHLPNISLGRRHVEVPPFAQSSPRNWKRKIRGIVTKNSNSREWDELRPAVFREINHALLSNHDSALLDLLQGVLQKNGCADCALILPGLLANMRGSSASAVDPVLLFIMRNAKASELITALQPQITTLDMELSRAALGFQTKLIASLVANEVLPQIASIVGSLRKAFESELPEIRKAVVQCFVELYGKLGKELMDKQMAQFSKGQQRLVAIYLSRRK
jgi:hypothetical protein